MHPTACGPGVPTGNEQRLAREFAALTGEDVTAAVTEAIRDRLERVRREQGDGLAERLLAIGRDCAVHLKEPFRSIDHGELLFDERGLPW
ncbi:MAG: type II toxin-antitoxin system VapB family antitoxin [Thermomicrobiales bacterium]